MTLRDIGKTIADRLDASLLREDEDSWNSCLSAFPHDKYVSVQYKPSFIRYQEEYFTHVYEEYTDCSLILKRGGIVVGIWPLCLYYSNNEILLGSNGSDIVEPLFSNLPKAEAQRDVIQQIIDAFVFLHSDPSIPLSNCCLSAVTTMDEGMSQWQRKWMEAGAICSRVSWWAYADLSLPTEEIQRRIRRTNRYSIEKARQEYDVAIYDSEYEINEVFDRFREFHCEVSGRMTRSQSTWDLQRDSILSNSDITGWDFVISLRDKVSTKLVGMALYTATPQTGYYAVAAYDRKRFDRPVGHVAQAVAMEYMKSKGVRWYEIGERSYPGDLGVNDKLINIGKYKEGFATHIFPRIHMILDLNCGKGTKTV